MAGWEPAKLACQAAMPEQGIAGHIRGLLATPKLNHFENHIWSFTFRLRGALGPTLPPDLEKDPCLIHITP